MSDRELQSSKGPCCPNAKESKEERGRGMTIGLTNIMVMKGTEYQDV
jgi:hypothetical protein